MNTFHVFIHYSICESVHSSIGFKSTSVKGQELSPFELDKNQCQCCFVDFYLSPKGKLTC